MTFKNALQLSLLGLMHRLKWFLIISLEVLRRLGLSRLENGVGRVAMNSDAMCDHGFRHKRKLQSQWGCRPLSFSPTSNRPWATFQTLHPIVALLFSLWSVRQKCSSPWVEFLKMHERLVSASSHKRPHESKHLTERLKISFFIHDRCWDPNIENNKIKLFRNF